MPSKTGIKWDEREERNCLLCGCSFNARLWQKRQVFCSTRCSATKRRRDKPEKFSRWRKSEYIRNRSAILKRARQANEKKSLNRFKSCRNCGERFHLWFGRIPHSFCSVECKRAKKLSQKREYSKKRSLDPRFRIQEAVRGTMRDYLRKRRIHFGKNIWIALGYSATDLRNHLEKFFTKANGFTWDNYGKSWHIDHVVPHNRFKYSSISDQEFKSAWALSNLRPLEALSNASKQDRYIGWFDKRGQLNFIA